MISRERAVGAALQAIDEDGLESFSLGLVAARLKVQVPSLYYHFHNKSELLSEVVRSLFLDAEQEFPRLGLDWKRWMVESSLTVRRKLLSHPNAVPLVLLNSPRDIVLKGYERSLRYLERFEIPKQKQLLIISGLDAIIWGSTLFEATALSRGIRTFALFDPASFGDGSLTRDASHIIDDEKMYVAVARSFLDGVVPDNEPLKKRKRIA
jgi:TetR/AcrR family transcriptional regulator, tetracycline repressor protein